MRIVLSRDDIGSQGVDREHSSYDDKEDAKVFEGDEEEVGRCANVGDFVEGGAHLDVLFLSLESATPAYLCHLESWTVYLCLDFSSSLIVGHLGLFLEIVAAQFHRITVDLCELATGIVQDSSQDHVQLFPVFGIVRVGHELQLINRIEGKLFLS